MSKDTEANRRGELIVALLRSFQDFHHSTCVKDVCDWETRIISVLAHQLGLNKSDLPTIGQYLDDLDEGCTCPNIGKPKRGD